MTKSTDTYVNSGKARERLYRLFWGTTPCSIRRQANVMRLVLTVSLSMLVGTAERLTLFLFVLALIISMSPREAHVTFDAHIDRQYFLVDELSLFSMAYTTIAGRDRRCRCCTPAGIMCDGESYGRVCVFNDRATVSASVTWAAVATRPISS